MEEDNCRFVSLVCLFVVCNVNSPRGGGGREGGKIPRQDCRNHFVKFAFVAVMEVVVASVAVALCRGRLTVAATNISGSSTSKNAQK